MRRLRAGERLDLTDGRGGLAECVVTSATRDELALEVTTAHLAARPSPRVVVVQALAKGERGELAVELMTEVGVDEIVPWAAARSIVRWDGDRGRRSLERWRSTAREAAKQSRRVWWPVVADVANTRDVAARLAAAPDAFVLHEEATDPLPAAEVSPGPVVFVVGPEGGVAPDELAVFTAAGARLAALGPTVLRTSTAGAVAAAVLLAATPRWQPPAPGQ